MTGFMIKKWFFDHWDNMFGMFLVNLGFAIVFALFFALPQVFDASFFWLKYAMAMLGILLLSIYSGAVSFFTRDIADYKSPGFKDLMRYLRETFFTGCFMGLMGILMFHVFLVVMPFYGAMSNFMGVAGTIFSLWMTVIWFFGSQYVFPVRARLDNKVFKIVKKSFLLFVDNIGFTVFMGIAGIFIIFLSGFTAFMIPGISSLLLWHQVGTKLRLLKYDYLETHPEAARKKLPWEEIMEKDRDYVGTRTLKGTLFPWRE